MTAPHGAVRTRRVVAVVVTADGDVPLKITIELFGPSCEDFKNNRKTSVIVEFGCAQVIVI